MNLIENRGGIYILKKDFWLCMAISVYALNIVGWLVYVVRYGY